MKFWGDAAGASHSRRRVKRIARMKSTNIISNTNLIGQAGE